MKKHYEEKPRRVARKVFGTIGLILGIIVLIVVAYVVYVFAAYHRAGSYPIEAQNRSSTETVSVGTEYKIMSYNIGFGAYEDDFGFFMDGGTEGQAWSKERLTANMSKIAEVVKNSGSDFYFIQEVDTNSTRSYYIDERPYLTNALDGMSYVFAENWDSPFLFVPPLKPHGSAKTGIMIFAKGSMKNSERVELPVETGIMKIVDLDRCYEKTYVETDNGKMLVLYNFHLSAYTSDGKIANEQLKMLISDIEVEYNKGNYCLAGGDFNKDILGDSSVYFGKSDIEYTWAQPLDMTLFEGMGLRLIAPLDE
ncbi:MAG: endonuclease/exonuclease/phosphatase family protein, partial [Clostridia bacterium]|nr:endonuclease/exonuclease/phosphatase family protein [Clostridia bacterium]